MRFLKLIRQYLTYITVEPLIFLFFWSIPYLDHGVGVLLFNKFCLNDNHDNVTLCDLISHHKENYTEANIKYQTDTSRWIMITKVVMAVPMLYSTTILGAISDRFQRKLPMVIPAVGIFIGCLWLITISLVKTLDVRFLLISSFIFGITGYYGSTLMATSAYLGVVTSASSRTWRISVFEAALALGVVIGSATSGAIIDHLGLPYIFGIVAGINFVAILYTVVRIVELHQVKTERPLWYELCEFAHVKEYLTTLYKPRSQNRRLYIHLMFTAFMITTCSMQGLYDVLFLFLTKSRAFTNTLFSIFTGTQAVIACIGNVVAMYILQKALHFSEPEIVIVSSVGSTLAYSMIAANDKTTIWTSVIFMICSGLNGGACRGFLSKLVPQAEQGQVFAFVAMGQCFTALIASVSFNNIYPATLTIWDGLCILLAGLLNLLAVVLSLGIYVHRRIKGHTDEALDLLSEPSVSMSSIAKTDNSDDEGEDDLYAVNHKQPLNDAANDFGASKLNTSMELGYGSVIKEKGPI